MLSSNTPQLQTLSFWGTPSEPAFSTLSPSMTISSQAQQHQTFRYLCYASIVLSLVGLIVNIQIQGPWNPNRWVFLTTGFFGLFLPYLQQRLNSLLFPSILLALAYLISFAFVSYLGFGIHTPILQAIFLLPLFRYLLGEQRLTFFTTVAPIVVLLFFMILHNLGWPFPRTIRDDSYLSSYVLATIAVVIVCSLILGYYDQQRKRADEALQTAFEEIQNARLAAEIAERTKSEFLANMSHELRTPLNAILGYTDLIKEEWNATPQNQQDLTHIRTSSHQLLRTIGDLLDLNKLEANPELCKRELFPVAELLQEFGDSQQGPNTSTNKHHILPCDSNLLFAGDRVCIRRMLYYLFSSLDSMTKENLFSLRATLPSPHELQLEIQMQQGSKQLISSLARFLDNHPSTEESHPPPTHVALGSNMAQRFCNVMQGVMTLQADQRRIQISIPSSAPLPPSSPPETKASWLSTLFQEAPKQFFPPQIQQQSHEFQRKSTQLILCCQTVILLVFFAVSGVSLITQQWAITESIGTISILTHSFVLFFFRKTGNLRVSVIFLSISSISLIGIAAYSDLGLYSPPLLLLFLIPLLAYLTGGTIIALYATIAATALLTLLFFSHFSHPSPYPTPPGNLPQIRSFILLLAFLAYVFLVGLHDRTIRGAQTRMLQALKILRQSRQKAEQANRSKTLFLTSMSHEFRTPLNTILGYTELLQEELQNPQIQQDLQQIHEASHHLLQLTNELLDLNRIEANKVELKPTPFPLEKLLRDVQKTIRPLTLRHRNQLQVVAPTEPICFSGDRLRLKQILFNLLSNACKFTHQGTITLRVELHHKNGRNNLFLEVSDEGIGMDDTQIQRLFQPFQQAHAGITQVYGGTGLGLAISQRLCHAMNGTIHVQSQPHQGTTFHIQIPEANATEPLRETS